MFSRLLRAVDKGVEQGVEEGLNKSLPAAFKRVETNAAITILEALADFLAKNPEAQYSGEVLTRWLRKIAKNLKDKP